MERITVLTQDSWALAATVFAADPAGGEARGGVLLAGAMATPQQHYEPFARWLAAQGFTVLTLDYRGTFASGGERVASTVATFDTWGQQDVSAAARFLRQRVPDLPLYYLGHSLGGQLFASSETTHLFQRAILVASGSGYWPRLRRAVPRWGLFAATQIWGPLLVPLFGYFPGQRLRKVGNIPAGVMRQWTRWCRHPDYLARDAHQRERFERVQTPITYFNSSDDEVFSQWSADRFVALFGARREPVQCLTLEPENLGVRHIGHFGYFRDRLRASFWPQLVQHLHA
jgi:predicted alpha/beta hydrolase